MVNGEVHLRIAFAVVLMVASVWPARAAVGYSESEGACRLLLDAGAIPSRVDEVEAMLKKAFAFTGEFEPLPAGEAELINAAAKGAQKGAPKTPSCKPSTYLSLPVDEVFAHSAFALQPGRSRVYDLGAGLGRPVLRAVLIGGAAAGVGVEVSATRWRAGCRALRQLSWLLAASPRPTRQPREALVELRLGDALEANVSDATHVLLFATCFPPEPLAALQRKLLRELPDGGRIFCVGDREVWLPELQGVPPAEGRRMLQVAVPKVPLAAAVGGKEEEEDVEISRRVWRIEGAAAASGCPEAAVVGGAQGEL